jgi:hypothetical protein
MAVTADRIIRPVWTIFFESETPRSPHVYQVFILLQCVINLFPLEHLIPIDSVHKLFQFLEGFASSSEVQDKVVHYCYAAPRRG